VYKTAFISTLILFSLSSKGQSLDSNFTGTLFFNRNYYSAFITYDSCDDFTEKRTLVQSNGFFTITDSTYEMNNGFEKFEPIRFIRSEKYLKLIYFNPILSSYDTINQYAINIGDTAQKSTEYLIYFDSVLTQQKPGNRQQLDIRMSSNYIHETVNIGDTTIKILDESYSCYRFERFDYMRKSNPGPSHTKQVIFIDKKSLLPIQEERHAYYYRHPCITTNKWVLISRFELIRIKTAANSH